MSTKALSDFIVSAGESALALSPDLGVWIVVTLGIILCAVARSVGVIVYRAARGVGTGLEIGLRAKVLAAFGVDDPERRAPDE